MKQIINVTQGTKEWLSLRTKYFTASEAAAMLGLSKYMTRTQLLDQKASGVFEEVDQHKQRIFDKGHEAEALARPIMEAILGEELYPATITNEIDGIPLLASMDGINMLNDVGWEHKLFNRALALTVGDGSIPSTHWPQLEHQLLVSECDVIHFTVSDGTEENWVSCEYRSDPKRRQQVIDGWKQFAKDLSEHVVESKAESVEAEPVRDLPALNYKMNGLSLVSNLDEYKVAATELVEKSKLPLETDQDFANAESMVKIFKAAEDNIKLVSKMVLGEIPDIDQFVKDLDFISESIRQARLAADKQVKTRKDEIKAKILTDAKMDLYRAMKNASEQVNATFPELSINISEAMKGKKTVQSLKDAADSEVAKGNVEITNLLNTALQNKAAIDKDFQFLFNDWQQIAFKAPDDFKALVAMRVSEYNSRPIEVTQAPVKTESTNASGGATFNTGSGSASLSVERVHNEIVAALVSGGISEADAKAVVTLAAKKLAGSLYIKY